VAASPNTAVRRPEWLAVARERIEVYRHIISILHDSRAPLLLGTDTPNAFVFQGFSIRDELMSLRQAGLSAYGALGTGAADADRFLGQEA